MKRLRCLALALVQGADTSPYALLTLQARTRAMNPIRPVLSTWVRESTLLNLARDPRLRAARPGGYVTKGPLWEPEA